LAIVKLVWLTFLGHPADSRFTLAVCVHPTFFYLVTPLISVHLLSHADGSPALC